LPKLTPPWAALKFAMAIGMHRLRPPALNDDIVDTSVTSKSWIYNSLSGSMLHKASGMRFSPSNGIQWDGREYKLSAADIDIDEDGFLGSGASGSVWRGKIKANGSRIALKTLKVDNKEERQLLLNEVRALIEAEGCPYVVQWHAGFASHRTGQVHLVLELMDYGSLADLRSQLQASHRAIPSHMLAGIAAQVLRGLEHLHSRRLLHNDIKLGNILLNWEGEVKITDFRITKCLDASICDACVGTQTYLAPEKFSASARGVGYSLPADIWSLGIVLFELVSGMHPFARASNFIDILAMVTKEPEPRLLEADGYPLVLCDFVERCLTRDPCARANVQELLGNNFVVVGVASRSELSEWLGSLPGAARTAGN
jgi:serine/threonine protein kinase